MFSFGPVNTQPATGGTNPLFRGTISEKEFDVPSVITRVNLVKYLQELLIETELIRTKLASLLKQAKTSDQFASMVTEFVLEQRSGYSKTAIHYRILEILNEARSTLAGFTSRAGFSFGVGEQHSEKIYSYEQVTRATEFNSQVFETLVERNTRLGKAINQNSIRSLCNNEEIMQQYQDCHKLAKIWIMQDLSEQFNNNRNEWKDNLLLANLPFDIKFEIISFIPIEYCKSWWAHYWKFRIISNSVKQRLERTMFSKITREGIDLSNLPTNNETTQDVREFLTCHSNFETSKLNGTKFIRNFSRNPKLGFSFMVKERIILPHNDKAIRPKDRVKEKMDPSLIFDKEFIEKAINEISNGSNERFTPFEKHFHNDGYVIPYQELDTPKLHPASIRDRFKNPFIKQVVINIGNMSWLDTFTELEELTVLIDLTDFLPAIQTYCSLQCKKLKKFNLVIYKKSGFSWQMIELLMEKTLGFAGVLTIYADMDNAYLNSLSDPSFETSIFLLDQQIRSSLDFKDLKLVLKPIQEFSVTKEILEKGWYRSVKHLPETTKSASRSKPEEMKDPIFGANFFDIHQKKELIKYFVNYGYPFEWHKSKTQLDEALIQYYLHLLNVNQLRLNYHGSFNPCDCSNKLLDIIVWGYDITICPEIIFHLCTVFGNIGVKLTIEKLKSTPNYINIDKFKTLIQKFNNSTMVIYYLAQLIPYIQNSENLEMLQIVNGLPDLLTSYILENYCDITYLESENTNRVSKFIILLQTNISNSCIERLARKFPKLLYQKSSISDQTPLHYCFTNKMRYQLIKPFIEIAPETIDYEDKYGYKPYHLIPELKTVDFELEFFQKHILPDSLNHILLGKKY